MIIRNGLMSDLHDLGRLWLAMVNEVSPHHLPNLTWWIEETMDMMDGDDYLCFVAEDDGEIVGFTDGVVQRDSGMGKVVFFSRHTSIIKEYRHGETVKGLFQAISDAARRRGAISAMFCCDVSLITYWRKIGYRQTEAVMEGALYGNG